MSAVVFPILKREYLTRVRSKAFWISTAIFPLLMIGFTILPSVFMARTKSSPDPIRVVDQVGDFFPVLQEVFSKRSAEERGAEFQAEDLKGRTMEDARRQLNDQTEKGEFQGYILVDRKGIDEGTIVYYARNPSSALAGDGTRSIFREAITQYRLQKMGLKASQIESATKRLDFDVRKATNDPSKEESGVSAFLMSVIMVMMIYGSLIFYGIYVMRGVLEEKSNRIVEIIVSTVKPFDLMMGKILGIGLVGLTQISIWAAFSLLLTAPQIGVALSLSKEFMPTMNLTMLAFFPVYFVLGYFLYATMYAGIGSMFNSEEDAQQMASVVTMLIAIPVMTMFTIIKNPGSNLAVALSMFPFFTPILMYLRIAIQTPPMWQIALSIGIMLVTIVFMIWLVSKIYRVGIFMYGKKPTIPEILRWLRYT